MKKKQSYVPVVVLFVISLVFLGAGIIGSSLSELNIESNPVRSDIEMKQIGISLIENGTVVAQKIGNGQSTNTKALLSNGSVSYTSPSEEVLRVGNLGTIEEYVRVTVRKYWLDEDGKKNTSLDPALILLNLNTEDWIVDEDYTEEERVILYYPNPLPVYSASDPDASKTPWFLDEIRIGGQIKNYYEREVKQEGEYTVVKLSYTYDGKKICLDVQADGIQTHSAVEAFKSAWGIDVSIDENGKMSLVP